MPHEFIFTNSAQMIKFVTKPEKYKDRFEVSSSPFLRIKLSFYLV